MSDNTCGTCEHREHVNDKVTICRNKESRYAGMLLPLSHSCILPTAGHEPGWRLGDAPFHDSCNARWVWTLWTENEKIICHIEASTEEECRERGLLILKAPTLVRENERLRDSLEELLNVMEDIGKGGGTLMPGEYDKAIDRAAKLLESALTAGGNDGK